MTSNNLKAYIKLEAIKATLVGMQAEDVERISRGLTGAYSEQHYDKVSKEITALLREVY